MHRVWSHSLNRSMVVKVDENKMFLLGFSFSQKRLTWGRESIAEGPKGAVSSVELTILSMSSW